MMKFTPLSIPGLVLIEPQVFGDNRGFFMETYNKKEFTDNGITVDFVQDNHSRSAQGVLRGLHFQKPPFAQAKLVRVTNGEVLDVAVDLRPDSPTFGKYDTAHLTAENKNMFFIPAGFAHGFYTLSETADFQYKCSNFYNKESEGGIIWNDPDINVAWLAANPLLAEKDKIWPKLKDIEAELKTLKW
ncbi:MAG: dTDP-4-dehydrorhamnose 3,5-epimerase [Candidatus Shapirobacteria bacterium GW2011_GWE1_38_10]|uniref:dTDP-4-dehydrorhamnose 3,5-epimerase n=1 Tax=Candidatus Shapirobacteria bacterium GW2011_GWE1_38_10 TaxID=1618488 RepID=A0A0G0I6H8_9BACT|nr:MAG: dTDP-4-dehydrorhamnose 3,5-epimerase [Candidatus Shapirobacteria bacterium GW2011_GWF2_37_20]KKQ50132.1 MAG: dTDP-4-dehydrorhamnose 3,5-epimerase [Candidatus Shapirobacteria bacterium GW2011_GWE1_38_10]HBP51468.1 dTDP-4-dehydrorhamnose 3,5-epimerase [Candidatus Shapirobacteria bacterium]